MNKLKFSALVVAATCVAGSVSAESDAYFGGAFGALSSTSSSGIASATMGGDKTLGVLVGYRRAISDTKSLGVEAGLDLSEGTLMSYGGTNACSDTSPDWCRVEKIARVRGVYTTQMQEGLDFIAMAGFAFAQGVAEDGPGVYANSSARGFSLSIGTEAATDLGTLRFEFTYDRLNNVRPNEYDKSLKLFSMKTSLLF